MALIMSNISDVLKSSNFKSCLSFGIPAIYKMTPKNFYFLYNNYQMDLSYQKEAFNSSFVNQMART